MLPIVQHRLKLSSATLLGANLLPLAGVSFLGWSVSSVIILYWFENIVIGVLNVARMLRSAPDERAGHGLKFILIPFFIFHYFFFCAGHGIFVFGMFPDQDGYFATGPGIELLGTLFRAIEIFATPLAFAAAALAARHIVSFVLNYLGGHEYERLGMQQLMMLPYGRIVVLHVTILFGGFAIMALGEPIWLILIMVVVKVAVDLKFHLREHLRLAANPD
jgi:hypothetical protein